MKKRKLRNIEVSEVGMYPNMLRTFISIGL